MRDFSHLIQDAIDNVREENQSYYSPETVLTILLQLKTKVRSKEQEIQEYIDNEYIEIDDVVHFIADADSLSDEQLTGCAELSLDTWNNQINVTMTDNVRDEVEAEFKLYVNNLKSKE